MTTQLPLRKDEPDELKWDLTLHYPDDQAMQADLGQVTKQADQLAQLKGHLGDSA